MRLHVNSLMCATLIGFALILLSVVPANAAVVTKTVSVTANGMLTFAGPNPPPVDPVTLSFTITYDPNLDYVDNTANIVLNSLNIALDYPLAFSYDPDPVTFVGGTVPAGQLRVGGLFAGDASGTNADRVQFQPPTNDFWLYINDFATNPTFQQLGYSQTAPPAAQNLWGTVIPALSVHAVADVSASTVPEPASATIFALGIALVGGLTRFRRRSAAGTA